MNTEKNESLEKILEIDKIIHEPARLLILSYLAAIESSDFLFLLRKTGLTRGNLSSHLTKLENAGFIEIRKEFIDRTPHTVLRITNKGKKDFKDYRKRMKEFMDQIEE